MLLGYPELKVFFTRCLAAGLVIAPALGHAQLASQVQDLSAGPWRLLVDPQAAWQGDKLFLPEEVNLEELPVHPPTGGWGALGAAAGIPVTLPSTVEEHYWGQFNPRPYSQKNEFDLAKHDTALRNGNYLGVSWWYQTFTAPTVPAGSRLLLHVQGSRLRTEIYVNGKLTGYSILSELPIDADITSAVQAGAPNQLAIRITNAGGRWDWRDWWTFAWGSYMIPSSIGAGGLDSGVMLEVVNATRVSDLAVLNEAEPHVVQLQAEVTNPGASYTGEVLFKIKNSKGAVVQTAKVPATVPAGATSTFTAEVTVAECALWTLEAPTLYTATAELRQVANSTATRTFGFRSFAAVGIGSNAQLQLNQQRIVLRSAISWGFWAPNALWPTAQTEQNEIKAAKAMGLNCLQSHRGLSKVLTLDAQDAAGLLRYEEPGAGTSALATGGGPSNAGPPDAMDVMDTSGNGGAPTVFSEQYEEAKILAMVKRDRSHPSLIMYCIQNELLPDLHNERIYELMRQMHAVDPSRIILLKSGPLVQYEAYMLPWDDTIYHDDDTGYSGWRDEHTSGGPGTWSRSLYTDPANFSHRSTNQKQIVVWGEMLGAGTPNDHRRIVADYAQSGTTGYDLADEATVDAAYAAFLQNYGFTAAFPTTSDLYASIADKSYYEWQRMLENTRVCDATDYIVMSGWESTSIENHSGLLDAHRIPKDDPAILAQANAPLMLVVRPRRFVLSTNEGVAVDVFLVNEVGVHGNARLTLTATGPNGGTLFHREQVVSITGGDVFGQLLKADFQVPGAAAAGDMTLTAKLVPDSGLPAGVSSSSLVRSETVSVTAPTASALPARVVVVDDSAKDIAGAFQNFYHAPILAAGALQTGAPVDAIVFAGPAAAQHPALLAAALQQVHDNGARLVIWPDNGGDALGAAQTLAAQNILQLQGDVGNCRAPWMGTWYFVRDNPVFNGLPVNTALDHRYELPQEDIGEDGLLLSAAGLQVYVGYGRDHDPTLGIGLCVIPYGSGRIVLSSIGSEVSGLEDNPAYLPRPIALRLLSNAIAQPLP